MFTAVHNSRYRFLKMGLMAAFLFEDEMEKIVSRSYSAAGRKNHDRIFGNRKMSYEDKSFSPGDKKESAEVKNG